MLATSEGKRLRAMDVQASGVTAPSRAGVSEKGREDKKAKPAVSKKPGKKARKEEPLTLLLLTTESFYSINGEGTCFGEWRAEAEGGTGGGGLVEGPRDSGGKGGRRQLLFKFHRRGGKRKLSGGKGGVVRGQK